MRKVRITTTKRHIEAEDNTMLMCPVRSDGRATFYCTDKCAWFGITEEISQATGGFVYARCGNRIIGELKELTNEDQS